MRALSLLFLAALLACSLQAQSSASTATNGSTTTDEAATTSTQISSNNSKGAPEKVASNGDEDAQSASAQQSKSAAQQGPKPGKPKPSSGSDLPPIAGSMVGYIDNAIVGSEIRIRVDAGFGNNSPDRAEFFYAQCGCDGPGAHGPGPGLATNINFQQLYMRGEYAPNRHFSLLVDVPVRWIQPQSFDPKTLLPGQLPFGNESGISDVQAGFKLALLASQQRYLTVQFLATFPSGNSYMGLGTGHYSVMPSLLYFQKVTDRFSFEAQAGDTHPMESSGQMPFAGDVFTYGIGPSYELYRGEQVRFAPVLELVGWRVLGGMENNAAALNATGNPFVNVDGINIVNLKAGARTTVGRHQSFYVGFGQALTQDRWYRHIIRFEYRYTF
jgi:hypothetical protein